VTISPEDWAVFRYRLDRLDSEVQAKHGDHERRIRDLETAVERVATRVAIYAGLGSILGGAVISGIISFLIK
jgi:hypothetical protein